MAQWEVIRKGLNEYTRRRAHSVEFAVLHADVLPEIGRIINADIMAHPEDIR